MSGLSDKEFDLLIEESMARQSVVKSRILPDLRNGRFINSNLSSWYIGLFQLKSDKCNFANCCGSEHDWGFTSVYIKPLEESKINDSDYISRLSCPA